MPTYERLEAEYLLVFFFLCDGKCGISLSSWMAGEAGDGTTKEVGSAQKLGKEGHHVTRVGQSRVIVWDAFLRGSYARQRARSAALVYEILNELRNEIRP
jgi:hypothetical protein